MVINVQFADDTATTVVAYFAAPQDPEIYAHLGQIVADDARWTAFLNGIPEGLRAGLPTPSVA